MSKEKQSLDKLEKLKVKQRQITERIKQMESRERAMSKKLDTRRKILVGAYTLEQALSTDQLHKLYTDMQKWCKRPNDKSLFENKEKSD